MGKLCEEESKVTGYLLLDAGRLVLLGVEEIPAIEKGDEACMRDSRMKGNSLLELQQRLRVLFVTLPKSWTPEFGALVNGTNWITGPPDPGLWLKSLEVMAAIGGTPTNRQASLLFCDTYDLDRQERTGQQPGMVPAFFGDLLEGQGKDDIARAFPVRDFICSYSFDLSDLGPEFTGQHFILQESVQVSEVSGAFELGGAKETKH